MRKMQGIVHFFPFKICYVCKAEWPVTERAETCFVCPGLICALPLVNLCLCCLGTVCLGVLAWVLFTIFVALYFLDI